jgi:hypothetical protein
MPHSIILAKITGQQSEKNTNLDRVLKRVRLYVTEVAGEGWGTITSTNS